MDHSKLAPILNKESILKTANARELGHAPQDVFNRYRTYSLTHVPLGDTSKQLANLQRVVVENKTCAVGTIVGPYGYGKTSTAVHLWNELREQKIMAVPPFLWANLPDLMDAVYHWLRFEFAQGPQAFVGPLEALYNTYRQRHLEELSNQLDGDVVQALVEQGRLILDIRPDDTVGFFDKACQICEQAGYKGLVVFTDELQVTIAEYKPSRDQFFNDLFQIVKDILGLPGHWAVVISMNDDTEGTIGRLRADLIQRMQRSALYFRVEQIYRRREFPTDLWAAFEKRFGFNGAEVMQPDTLDAIGQVAARSDLGAGPRMVTHAMSLAVKRYLQTDKAYTPIQFVDDFLAGQMVFDQRGRFVTAVRKALDNREVRDSEAYQQVVKLLAAFPAGCTERTLEQSGLLASFRSFPPLARRELVLQVSGGYILRHLAEEETAPEHIEQRLTKEFVSRYAPGRQYAAHAAEGFVQQVLLEPTFSGWKSDKSTTYTEGNIRYRVDTLQGTFDGRYPDRTVAVLVAAVSQSPAPQWKKGIVDADIELRFELNYGLPVGEPNRLLVSPQRPDMAVFQLNLNALDAVAANKILPSFLHDYYAPEQLTPLLALALTEHLYENRGDLPDDQNRISTVIGPLRQYVLTVLFNERLQTLPQDYAGTMVGMDRIKELFRNLCKALYPHYRTLIANPRAWQQNLQQYNYALQKVTADDGISIARGRRSWKASKEAVADAFRIPGRRLTNLETLLDALGDLVVKEEFSGRTPTSEVTLRFQLHPLEQEWLKQLETSGESVRHNGNDVPALPAETLMRQAKAMGYTDAEVREVMRLLRSRGYIDLLADRNYLVRVMDAVDDLRDAVQQHIGGLERQVQAMAVALPDFEAERYPVAKLRAALAEATERDELENIRAEVRQLTINLNTFAAVRVSVLRDKLLRERDGLTDQIRQGIPPWLRREFPDSPLQAVLEKQRQGLTATYDATLSEIRQVLADPANQAPATHGASSEVIAQTQEVLVNISKHSRRLRTRLESYQEYQASLDAWHSVSSLASELASRAKRAHDTYGHVEFAPQVEQLWRTQHARFEAQQFAILTAHTEVKSQIEAVLGQITAWLDDRRADFERQCQEYQQALNAAGVEADIRIPFDQERPKESYTVLEQYVQRVLTERIDSLMARLGQSAQIIRYGIQVQRLPLAEIEGRAHTALGQATHLREQLARQSIRDFQAVKDALLSPLTELAAVDRDLEAEVRKTMQPRPAEGSEAQLMEMLATTASGQPIDLRGLIIRLLDQGSQPVELDRLMKDLESLFQKNQITIRVGRR